MQQPPHGRPLPGQQPQRPPAYVPPHQQPQQPHPQPQYQQQPHYPQQPYQPPVQQPPQQRAPLPPPAAPRKSRGALRFLAGTCVFSGWATLVLSVIFAVLTFMGGMSAAAMLGATASAPKTNYFQQTPPTIDPNNPLGALGGASGGLGGLGGAPAGPFTGLVEVLRTGIPAVTIAGTIFTLVSGIVAFLMFLGLGQACYVLLDLEEQQHRLENMLQVMSMRPTGR